MNASAVARNRGHVPLPCAFLIAPRLNRIKLAKRVRGARKPPRRSPGGPSPPLPSPPLPSSPRRRYMHAIDSLFFPHFCASSL